MEERQHRAHVDRRRQGHPRRTREPRDRDRPHAIFHFEGATKSVHLLHDVHVVHVTVTGPEALEEVGRYERTADALLLDSGSPSLLVRELGGTARMRDWSRSRRIVAAASSPVFLAGGLTPHDVASAATQVAPYGLDVCSGVRTDGFLDEAKLAAFVSAPPRFMRRLSAADLCISQLALPRAAENGEGLGRRPLRSRHGQPAST